MGESWFGIIKQVGIFMICAQMLLHFKASENYGKYIRLLMSMMVLIQLAVPLSGLLRGRTGENLAQGLTRYETLLTERLTLPAYRRSNYWKNSRLKKLKQELTIKKQRRASRGRILRRRRLTQKLPR